MRNSRNLGFAAPRLLLWTVVIIGVIAGIIFGYSTYSSSQSEKKEASTAQKLSNQFVSYLGTEESTKAYALLGPSVQQELGSMVAFTLWSDSFTEARDTMATTPLSSDSLHNNGDSEFYYTYTINENSSLEITVGKNQDEWVIANFKVINS